MKQKYHKNSFCVVVSKIDDMDCDAFCKGSTQARRNTQLQADVNEIKSASIKHNEVHKQLRKAKSKLESMDRKAANLERKIAALSVRGRGKKATSDGRPLFRSSMNGDKRQQN
ncbi:hypothetical protein VTK26DRAFT_2517 [Humicola hyalothermophila]